MMLALDFPERLVELVLKCVSTPKFSLVINGEMDGVSSSNRGLRQGDPRTLTFGVCNMYKIRAQIPVKMSALEQFHFHPRCNHMKLTHLSFADDLFLCSKGEYASVYLMLYTTIKKSLGNRLKTA